MSCNGCRVLRKGCSEACVLRPCLEWIESPEAQGNATLFVSKFFGRSDLIAFVSAVPQSERPALFQSLLFEACGRTVNPVNGAVGLLSTGNWHVCQAAMETVLAGGTLRPLAVGILTSDADESSENFRTGAWLIRNQNSVRNDRSMTAPPPSDFNIYSKPSIAAGRGDEVVNFRPEKWQMATASFCSDLSDISTTFVSGEDDLKRLGGEDPKLLNLFV